MYMGKDLQILSFECLRALNFKKLKCFDQGLLRNWELKFQSGRWKDFVDYIPGAIYQKDSKTDWFLRELELLVYRQNSEQKWPWSKHFNFLKFRALRHSNERICRSFSVYFFLPFIHLSVNRGPTTIL